MAGDNCNTSLYHLVILVVQIVALGVSPLAMGPVIRFCFAKGLVTEATIYLIYSLASIGRCACGGVARRQFVRVRAC